MCSYLYIYKTQYERENKAHISFDRRCHLIKVLIECDKQKTNGAYRPRSLLTRLIKNAPEEAVEVVRDE